MYMVRALLLFACSFDLSVRSAPSAGDCERLGLDDEVSLVQLQSSVRHGRKEDLLEDALGLLERNSGKAEAPNDLSLLQKRFSTKKVNAAEDVASEATAKFKSFCEEDNFVLEWSDEFDGKQLDTNVWQTVNSEGRASGPQTSVVAGLEVTACRTADCRHDNVHLKDGKLILLSERSSLNASQYYTGAITTKGRKTWADSPAYRMCVSAKLPGAPGAAGKGIWPAHWMLPDNGISDSCLDEGEMDIMEMVNSDGGSYSTYHWMSSYPARKCADFNTFHKSAHALTRMPSDWNHDFHEYGLERSPEHLAFAVDGKVVLNMSAKEAGSQLSHTPFFLILNTAIGGGWPGEPTEFTQLPVEHAIDYVRVARQKTSVGGSAHDPVFRPHGPSLAQVSSNVHKHAGFAERINITRPPMSFDHRQGPFASMNQ